MNELILAINPGSTSTKIAVFREHKQLFVSTLRHSAEELAPFKRVADQFLFRKEAILKSLQENDIDLHRIAIIVGRGGLIKPIKSGVYQVNELMKKDLEEAIGGEHASNLGGLIADNLAKEFGGCKAYIADPVVVDEMEPVARIAGHPLFTRRSIFHALNQKAIAKNYAATLSREYSSLNLIVAHLGGGVSVGAHSQGRVIDVNNALDGDGPFSPERSGSIAAYDLVKLALSGEYSQEEIKKMLIGEGGLVAHLGTNSFKEVETKVKEGDEKFALISDAFVYNVAKSIGAMATVLKGKVDAILITGGVAYNSSLMDQLVEMVNFISEVKIYPGEDEMSALAMNGLALLKGEIEAKLYE